MRMTRKSLGSGVAEENLSRRPRPGSPEVNVMTGPWGLHRELARAGAKGFRMLNNSDLHGRVGCEKPTTHTCIGKTHMGVCER